MTEKRFIVQERCVVDTTDNETFEFSFKVDAEIICEKLNNVVDENEQLKKEIEYWKKHCINHGIAVPITWGDKND